MNNENEEWDGIVRRSLGLQVRSISEASRTIEVVASTKDLDAHGDIVEQSFDLKRFKNNPVILWMHNAFGFLDGSSAKDFMPIGKAVDIGIQGGELRAKVHFLDVSDAPPEEEQIVKMVWRRVKQGVLRAVSIGFKPGEVSEEKKDGRKVYRLKKNELFEISFVPMGANPNAVAKAAKFEREQLERLVEASKAYTPRPLHVRGKNIDGRAGASSLSTQAPGPTAKGIVQRAMLASGAEALAKPTAKGIVERATAAVEENQSPKGERGTIHKRALADAVGRE